MSKGAYNDAFWKQRQEDGQVIDFGWNKRTAFSMIEPGSSVLDLGCGLGSLGEHLTQEKGCTYLGVDISEDAVRATQQKGLDAMVLDVEDNEWPFQEKQFDYIVGTELLEHLFEPTTLLQKIHSTGHTAIFSYGNASYWRLRVAMLRGTVPQANVFKNGIHLWYWNYNTYQQLFRDSGFDIEELRILGRLPVVGRFMSQQANERVIRNVFPNAFTYGLCIKVVPNSEKI